MRLCLIVGSMLCLPIAQAADSQGNFAVKGVANVSCKDYAASAAQGGPELSQYLGHVNGYVSAYNALSVNTFDVLSWQSVDTILLLLLSRCDKHPEVKFGAMLTTLLGYLHEHRVQAVASRVALGPKENSLYLYEPVFKELTQRLQAAGYKQADAYQALLAFAADQNIVRSENFHQMALLRLFNLKQPDVQRTE